MPANEPLREFLRARRSRVRPDEAGIPAGVTVRRVAGLRREEVAQLVGVSVDYYTRFEQGRVSPSGAILERVGAALHLGADGVAHLGALVRGGDVNGGSARGGGARGVSAGSQTVRAELGWMLDSMRAPAFVVGRGLVVAASNEGARRLLPGLPGTAGALESSEADRSLARWVFLDPDSRHLIVDHRDVARDVVAALHRQRALFADDGTIGALVLELSAGSTEFSGLWAEFDVVQRRRGYRALRHPLVGDLTVSFESFAIAETDDQALIVVAAEPGSPSADALARLTG
ncbi:helix-turn-helix domain-containing protein [Marisediminicola senii]|uniref:helix-turn-helix domain-containing protein n=1 Tax=Marisediminicola senii TaxID=2711233 RepID=UPI0013ECD51C|nr:helix-turn-helix transcriptional regulator [Marisediminicola senii]